MSPPLPTQKPEPSHKAAALRPPIIRKPEYFRDLGEVDIQSLRMMAEKISDAVWANEDKFKENKFDMFHHTQHVVFRFIHRNHNPADFYETPAWPFWQALIEPIMRAAIKPYGFSRPVFPKAMLARLKAGHVIDRHTDGPGSNLRCHKIHVPLVTNAGVKFYLGDQSVHLAKGRAYEVNNIIRHGGENLGSEDRIHFIFEVYDADYNDAPARACSDVKGQS